MSDSILSKEPEHYKPTVAKFKFETLVEHCKRLEKELAESRAQVNEITLYQDNAVWFWQHDGSDYLDSLSCPIIIQPNQLRELIADKPSDYDALKAERDSALAREAALREELNQCGSMAAMVEEKEWAEHVGTGPISSRVESALTRMHNELSEARERLTDAEKKLGEAYECGYIDGQNSPNGYSDKADRDKCVAELLKPEEGS